MEQLYNQSDINSIARGMLHTTTASSSKATIIGLKGDLGAGKTTLVQEIARELRVQETVVSPTFVIAKWYKTANTMFTQLVHIDAYRIENETELEPLGFANLVKTPNTLIIIEWPEKIQHTLSMLDVSLYSIDAHENARTITGPTYYEKK